MLFSYLTENYKPNEPIFVSDISLPLISDNYLRVQIKALCDSGKLKRYDTGIYFLPSVSRLKGETTLPPDMVASYKYISRKGNVEGYYSGYTFANQIGLTTQVPYTIEIVSNNSGGNYREISLKGQRLVLRKPRFKVTKENYRILQFLDLLKDIEQYTDDENKSCRQQIVDYMKESNITKSALDQYISAYPDKIYRAIYEMRLYDVFA